MRNKTYIIFGAGKAGQDFASLFPEVISYFVDNDPDKWGTSINKILVCNPSQLLQEDRDCLRIFIASMYFNQIKKQLAAMGFQHQKHYFYIAPYYGLLRQTSFLDIIEMQANFSSNQTSVSLFDQLRMIFSIQEEAIQLIEEPRILLITDGKRFYKEQVAQVQNGLEKFFPVQIKVISNDIFTDESTWLDVVGKFKKLGYSNLLYLGPQDGRAEQFGTYFEHYHCIDNIFNTSDKKEWLDYLYAIANNLGIRYEKISVVVPNYNYEQYLSRRLQTIFSQKYPIYEIIFLDDVSGDDSVELAKDLLEEFYGLTRIVVNDTNSGSPFKQWVKGVELSQGDFIWIAEADDYASPLMLPNLMEAFEADKEIVLSFCDSLLVDEQGDWAGFGSDMQTDLVHVRRGGIRGGIYNGQEFVQEYMSTFNSIPNVSAVVIRKNAISKMQIENVMPFKQYGDWYFYLFLLKQGKVAYHATPMNFFRRQSQSVSVTMSQAEQQKERMLIEAAIVKRQEF
ncbi:glycosyltransferase family 2 protein [Anaerospora hongkongensis]|uniref:glycosyltransferase family 2 protein n=1 Tax=Anaerospora hongkongensis TaxID=244830 RepID=UPI0028999B2A|nr:glycosyltransferase family 2 protein [Anaerospora hongkongensis]